MKEDVEIADLVRGALEEGVALSERTLRLVEGAAVHEASARRHRRMMAWMGGSSLLAAASLSIVLLYRNVLSVGSVSDGMTEVREAVGLLCAVDGLDGELASFPPSEMLLAWQDAPCADLL